MQFARIPQPMFSRRTPKETNSDAALMRAMEIAERGRHLELLVSRIAIPRPAAGEVLVKVAYVGTNRADLLQVEGSYTPPAGASPIPGLEVSGTIDTLGEGVVGWGIGEKVCALLSG